jgi:glycosyltransferase involved in cell wall biosynthesis
VKKSILFVVGSLTMGGIETYITRLCYFLRNDYSLYVLNLTSKVDSHLFLEISKNAKIINFIDITSYKAFARWNFSAINHSLPINFSMLDEVMHNIDFVHSVDSETNMVGAEVSRHYNAKFITSSYHPMEYVWDNKFYFRQVQKKLIQNIDITNIFYMNEAVKKETIDFLNIKDESDNIIPLGVNLKVYEKCTPSFGSNKIVSIGRLASFKTYNEIMIKNIDRINENNGKNFEYHIYGDGILKDELIILAKQQKSKIVFHGGVDYEKLPNIFNDTFIFVGVGTTIIESSSAGVPSIIGIGDYNAEACYGFFSQYDNYLLGEICTDCDIISFEEIFNDICKIDQKDYLKLSEKHRNKAKRFNIEFVAKDLVIFFNKSSSGDFNVKHSKLRYFFSNLTWLFLNRFRILNDRSARYHTIV